MTIEAERPATSEDIISYKYFAEQLDPDIGVPVGMVPLENIFKKGVITLPDHAVWHDVGAGVFSSTSYILSRLSEQDKRYMALYASDPNFATDAL